MSGEEGAGTPVPPWRNSKAKQLLQDDIIAKRVTEDMDHHAVYEMRPEFKLYNKSNFKTNLKNLIECCKNPLKQKSKWSTSTAKHLLKEDIINGSIQDGMDPVEVYQ